MHILMQLDVVIPTYNRSALLKKAIDSLLRARIPAGLTVQIIAVDNNSTDDTKATVDEAAKRSQGHVSYVFEKQQGRSPALNAGIAAATGDLIGFIDDDEEIHDSWYETIYSAFRNNEVDFIGGPYLPRFEDEIPKWLPQDRGAVVGIVDGGDKVVPFDDAYPGILMGGNAIFKREMLQRVGPYSTDLGRSGTRLLSCEDEDMYQRLRAVGARGLYLPHLIVYHFIPRERLTKRYHRSWCFWQSVSFAVLDRIRPQPVPAVFGVPRYFYGRALRGMWQLANVLNREPGMRFSNELSLWELAGFFYGKHFYRPNN
ncbi:MAG TPA: glycosyltransferase family 2 protein [Pyrinomonadaceae bacterium]|nr:glycosyltransferase family 2 protein [Pyrinomonadaceae bacterium]